MFSLIFGLFIAGILLLNGLDYTLFLLALWRIWCEGLQYQRRVMIALAPEKNEPVSDKLVLHQIRRRAIMLLLKGCSSLTSFPERSLSGQRRRKALASIIGETPTA
jgi:hypothetical protein